MQKCNKRWNLEMRSADVLTRYSFQSYQQALKKVPCSPHTPDPTAHYNVPEASKVINEKSTRCYLNLTQSFLKWIKIL